MADLLLLAVQADLVPGRAWNAVDLNVILLLFPMMALVGVLKITNVFPWAVGSTGCSSARAAIRAEPRD